MGVGSWTRDGLRFRRFLYHGLRVPGPAQIETDSFVATATCVCRLAVNDRRHSDANGCTSIVAALALSRTNSVSSATDCGNGFRRSDGPNHSTSRQA